MPSAQIVAYGQGWAIGRPVAPWAPVSDESAARCRDRARAALVAPAGAEGDPLELVADALSQATAHDELAAALAPLAADLRATHVVVHERWDDALVPVSATGGAHGPAAVATPAMLVDGAVAVIDGAGAPDPLAVAELRARGFGSLLAVPVLLDRSLAGAVEIYAVAPRAWSRVDIRRARTAGHHVAAALSRMTGRGAPAAADDAFAGALD